MKLYEEMKMWEFLWEDLNTLNENMIEETKLTTILKDEFGSKTPDEGSSYITPDGTFLNMPDTHHDVLPVLARAGIISIENASTLDLDDFEDDSICGYDFEKFFTKSDINYIRCNDGTFDSTCCYINLPEAKPTNAQFRSLEQWLNERVVINPRLQRIELGSQFTSQFTNKWYYLADYTSANLIKLIKRYYASGRLYEKINK